MTHGKAPTATRSTLEISAYAGDVVWRAGTPPVFKLFDGTVFPRPV